MLNGSITSCLAFRLVSKTLLARGGLKRLRAPVLDVMIISYKLFQFLHYLRGKQKSHIIVAFCDGPVRMDSDDCFSLFSSLPTSTNDWRATHSRSCEKFVLYGMLGLVECFILALKSLSAYFNLS